MDTDTPGEIKFMYLSFLMTQDGAYNDMVQVCLRTYAHVCSRMRIYAHVCSRMLTSAGVCSRMLMYADKTYADVC